MLYKKEFVRLLDCEERQTYSLRSFASKYEMNRIFQVVFYCLYLRSLSAYLWKLFEEKNRPKLHRKNFKVFFCIDIYYCMIFKITSEIKMFYWKFKFLYTLPSDSSVSVLVRKSSTASESVRSPSYMVISPDLGNITIYMKYDKYTFHCLFILIWPMET